MGERLKPPRYRDLYNIETRRFESSCAPPDKERTKKMNLTLDDTRNILEIYGAVPAVPAGYEFTGELREPASEDLWLGAKGLIGKGNWSYRRLILRPEPSKVYTVTLSTTDIHPKGYEIPKGYEYADFSLVKYANRSGATHALDRYGNLSYAEDFFPDTLRILLKKKV